MRIQRWLLLLFCGTAFGAVPAGAARSASSLPQHRVTPAGQVVALPALRSTSSPADPATEKPRPPDPATALLPGATAATAFPAVDALCSCASGTRGQRGALPGIGCRGPPPVRQLRTPA